ncbi:fibrobacter succinogenes major paralogous domain-containing protein [candidate division KSB1 bacterium]|nr:fibrobacter succinogenes major paralogous domain-containing protein [candidate division KSB1 bacterium]
MGKNLFCYKIVLISFIILSLLACNKKLRKPEIITETIKTGTVKTGIVTDINGNIYKTIKIGNQWWMAENLKVTSYRNGDAIPNVTDNTEWIILENGAYCYFKNDSSNGSEFGVLYNWDAVNDSRNIAPAGWHVPTDEEWKQLEIHLGMSQLEADREGRRGENEGGVLKETGTVFWKNPNKGATNGSGFNARPGGSLGGYDGRFSIFGCFAFFWSASEYGNYSAWCRCLYYESDKVERNVRNRRYGFSVRCVRD